MNKLKDPGIKYECIANKDPKFSEDRVREAYFLLFDEMARTGKLDNLLKNKVKFIPPEQPSNI